MKRLITLTIFTILVFFLVFVSDGFAEEKRNVRIEINNLTSYPLEEVYYAPAGTQKWSGNLLERGGLDPWSSGTFMVPAGKYQLRAVYYLFGEEFFVEKTMEFKNGRSYKWPLEEEREPFFAEAEQRHWNNPYDYYDPYGYYDDYYGPYDYYDDYYGPYDYYDPYEYYDGYY